VKCLFSSFAFAYYSETPCIFVTIHYGSRSSQQENITEDFSKVDFESARKDLFEDFVEGV